MRLRGSLYPPGSGTAGGIFFDTGNIMDFTANRERDYRQRTDDMARRPMAGFARFICPECKTDQPLKGRKSRGARAGFRCARCAEKMAVKYG
jgi:predicted RNA-binding Zn-ribbon protein involved in translation (DUF1610 family)